MPADDASFRQWFYQRRSPGLVHRLERYKRGVLLTLLLTVLFDPGLCFPGFSLGRAVNIAMRIPTAAPNRNWVNIRSIVLQTSGFKPSQLPTEKQQAIQKLFPAGDAGADAARAHSAQVEIAGGARRLPMRSCYLTGLW
ncbi:Uncharacterised protein [Serratia fonticola]|uniref:Uncharacterized protein n=1 Tax=Serratia fonticola TaxID=47917 RepID=A0A4U9UV44_SERFO|nr:Uncharacterised protein [Serratia fonticola]